MSSINPIILKFSEQSPLTDICLVCKDDQKLYYSKYQLCKDSSYFLAILKEDKSVTEIPLDFDVLIVAVLIYIMDGGSIFGNEISEIQKSSNIIELYKLSFYVNSKEGMEWSSLVCKNLKHITPEIYSVLKQYKYPELNQLLPLLVDTTIAMNKDNTITDICNYYKDIIYKIIDKKDKILNFIIGDPSLVYMSLQHKNDIIEYIDKKFKDINNNKIITLHKFKSGEFIGQYYFLDNLMGCKYILRKPENPTITGKIVDDVRYDLDEDDIFRVKNYWKVNIDEIQK
jgi:hypothetical protein